MKHLFRLMVALLLMSAAPQLLHAQDAPKVVSTKKHKVVIQLATDDPEVHKAMFRQFSNFLNAAPNAKIEVVCHNKGLSFLKKSNEFSGQVQEFAAKGIDFVACENTMKQRNIKREELVDQCRTVPAGLVEIVMKQEQKWSYIKAGF